MKFEKKVSKDPCGYEILVRPTTESPFFGLKYRAIHANRLRAFAQSRFLELRLVEGREGGHRRALVSEGIPLVLFLGLRWLLGSPGGSCRFGGRQMRDHNYSSSQGDLLPPTRKERGKKDRLGPSGVLWRSNVPPLNNVGKLKTPDANLPSGHFSRRRLWQCETHPLLRQRRNQSSSR